MDIAYALANYLQNSNFGTVGSSIFVGQIPSGVNGIYIFRSTGTLENYLPIETSVIDIYAKNTSSQQAINTIEEIKRFMHRMHNTSTQDFYIYSMLAIGDVETIERDNEYAKIYKLSFEIKHRKTSLIS
jgi:hypothetical protein